MNTYKIAAIPGDGIGTEVIAAGLDVLSALAARDGGFRIEPTNFDWGSARYLREGAMMPAGVGQTPRGANPASSSRRLAPIDRCVWPSSRPHRSWGASPSNSSSSPWISSQRRRATKSVGRALGRRRAGQLRPRRLSARRRGSRGGSGAHDGLHAARRFGHRAL